MAVATLIQDLLANLQVTIYDHDPAGGSTDLIDIAWVDMRDSDSILIGLFRTVGTSACVLNVLANPDSAGGGTDVTVKSKTLTAAEPDAVGDYTWIEVSQAEIAEADKATGTARYVSANVSLATGTDELVVVYIRKPKHAKLDLTADVIA